MTPQIQALRMALCSMLADVTYPDVLKEEPKVTACLRREQGLTDTEWTELTQLALDWAETQGPLIALTIRKALGKVLSGDEEEALTHPARRASTREAMTKVIHGAPGMIPPDTTDVEVKVTTSEEAFGMDQQYLQQVMEIARTHLAGDPPDYNPPWYFAEEVWEKSRLFRAATTVADHGVRQDGNTWIVKGSSWEYRIPMQSMQCPCEAATKGKSQICRHRVAIHLHQCVEQALRPWTGSLPFGPMTPDERLAQIPPKTAQDAPESTNAPQGDMQDLETPEPLEDDIYGPREAGPIPTPEGLREPAHVSSTFADKELTMGPALVEQIPADDTTSAPVIPSVANGLRRTLDPLAPHCMVQDQIVHSAAMDQFIPAFIRAQQKMTNVVRDSHNPTFSSRYPSLTAVRDMVTPPLNAEGIAVLQPIHTEGGMAVCTTIFWHTSGQFLAQTLRLPAVKRAPRRNASTEETAHESARGPNAQEFGSASSYARRYQLLAMCNLGSEDDDAEHVATSEGRHGTHETPFMGAETPSGDDWRHRRQEIWGLLRAGGFTGDTREAAEAAIEQRAKKHLALLPENAVEILTALKTVATGEKA